MFINNRCGETARSIKLRSSGRVLAVSVASALLVAGCDTPEVTPHPDARQSAEAPCLAQVRSERIEIRLIQGTLSEVRIPNIKEIAPLFQGRLAPDGSYAAGSSDEGFVGIKLSGELLWHVKEVSFPTRPEINANGQAVVFTARDGRLLLFDVSTRNVSELGLRGHNPAWSPTGHHLAYDDGTQVRVYDLARRTSLTLGSGTEPSWLPDSINIAVRATDIRIDAINFQTGARREFISDTASVSVPRWSANGEWMMYTRRGPRHWWSRTEWTGSEPSQIVVRNEKTKTEASIGEFFKASPSDYTWVSSPNLCRSVPSK